MKQFVSPILLAVSALVASAPANAITYTYSAVMNAANEAAVARFLGGEIRFLDIPKACRAALDDHAFDPRPTLEDLAKVDARARQEVARWTA